MAKGDTKTNQYLDIAANGTRADLPTDTCCETRSQTLIREVAERIMDVEDEVEEIKNNPDVVDIVATYADLQAYDTQHLTDKDIIRVLQDETHDGESTYYRYNAQSGAWTYVGESKQYEDFVGTDGTTAGEAGLVPAPATTDAGKFLKADGTWDTAGGGGGSITELTAADYNYDFGSTGSNNGLAVWLMDAGTYYLGENMNLGFATAGTTPYGAGALLVVGEGTTRNYVIVVNNNSEMFVVETYSDGSVWNRNNILGKNNLRQTTGTSTTDVMSQKAVTSMIFNDPGSYSNVAIGTGVSTSAYNNVVLGRNAVGGSLSVAIGGGVASALSARATGNYTVAIGANSAALGSYSIALGSGSRATVQGQFDVGASSNDGYNSSNYRLLTGLYDPQTAHDAATKGYVDPTTDSSAPTTATVGRLGQIQIDTTTATAYMCVEADDVTPSYTWKQITA